MHTRVCCANRTLHPKATDPFEATLVRFRKYSFRGRTFRNTVLQLFQSYLYRYQQRYSNNTYKRIQRDGSRVVSVQNFHSVLRDSVPVVLKRIETTLERSLFVDKYYKNVIPTISIVLSVNRPGAVSGMVYWRKRKKKNNDYSTARYPSERARQLMAAVSFRTVYYGNHTRQ